MYLMFQARHYGHTKTFSNFSPNTANFRNSTNSYYTNSFDTTISPNSANFHLTTNSPNKTSSPFIGAGTVSKSTNSLNLPIL